MRLQWPCQESMGSRTSVVLTLAKRRIWWANVKPTLVDVSCLLGGFVCSVGNSYTGLV